MFTHRTHVKFIGYTGKDKVTYEPVESYIWAFLEFPPPVGLKYIIEHPQGFDKKDFFDERFEPGVNEYLDKRLAEGKKYLFVQSIDMEEITPEPAPNIEPKKEEPVNQLTSEPIPQSTDQPVNQSTNEQVNQSTNEPPPPVQDFTIELADEKFILPEKVFNYIAEIEAERNHFMDILMAINADLKKLNVPKAEAK